MRFYLVRCVNGAAMLELVSAGKIRETTYILMTFVPSICAMCFIAANIALEVN
jgi:hypothetical protein